ncbi:hypothetical protein [Microcella sp.]|uniref:hypothetical protein n=1 Tax=Microcella sp. TaxID=1913979 RepID=UPI0039194692
MRELRIIVDQASGHYEVLRDALGVLFTQGFQLGPRDPIELAPGDVVRDRRIVVPGAFVTVGTTRAHTGLAAHARIAVSPRTCVAPTLRTTASLTPRTTITAALRATVAVASGATRVAAVALRSVVLL